MKKERKHKADEDIRKPRSIKFSDKEWDQLGLNASVAGMNMSQFVRFKTLKRQAIELD